MRDVHQVVRVTKAEFEAIFPGVASDYSIGVTAYANDGQSVLMEYIFMDAKEEIAILEELYAA